jgi:hypothetical protein
MITYHNSSNPYVKANEYRAQKRHYVFDEIKDDKIFYPDDRFMHSFYLIRGISTEEMIDVPGIKPCDLNRLTYTHDVSFKIGEDFPIKATYEYRVRHADMDRISNILSEIER